MVGVALEKQTHLTRRQRLFNWAETSVSGEVLRRSKHKERATSEAPGSPLTRVARRGDIYEAETRVFAHVGMTKSSVVLKCFFS